MTMLSVLTLDECLADRVIHALAQLLILEW